MNWIVPGRRVLPMPREPASQLLPWTYALMAYVAALGGVGLLLVGDTEHDWKRSVAAEMTVEVPADASPARLQTVLALLRQTRGIVAVQPLTPADMARLLEPWLGPSVKLDDLPMPRLIDLRADPDANIDLAALHKQLAAVVPEARLDDRRQWLREMRRAARRIGIVLDACIAAGMLSIATAAVLTTRSALAAGRSSVELVHLLGAADRDIAGYFARRGFESGVLGGAIGGVAVMLTVIALGGAAPLVEPAAAAPLAAIGIGDWRLWAILVGIALAAGLTATIGTQATVLRRLAEMP